jgi:leader peptidase (prepilin peptidase)/N-methyltransferase
MTTILIIIAATGLGAAIGVWTRRLLASLTYRLQEERELAEPASRAWLIVASGLALGSVTAWLAYADHWPLALTVLPLTLAAPALAAIDLDVMRLPNRILGPTALFTIAGVVIAVSWSGDWMVLAQASTGAILSGGTFWLLNVVTRGGVGLGDVKLAALIGFATGSVSLISVWWAIAAGALVAVVWRKARKRTGAFAYGPYLLLGSWLAVLSSAW